MTACASLRAATGTCRRRAHLQRVGLQLQRVQWVQVNRTQIPVQNQGSRPDS